MLRSNARRIIITRTVENDIIAEDFIALMSFLEKNYCLNSRAADRRELGFRKRFSSDVAWLRREDACMSSRFSMLVSLRSSTDLGSMSGWNVKQPRFRDPAARCARALPLRSALFEKRACGTPDARRVRGLVCKTKSTRVSHHGHAGYIRRSARGG
jgi:hypothetical protein